MLVFRYSQDLGSFALWCLRNPVVALFMTQGFSRGRHPFATRAFTGAVGCHHKETIEYLLAHCPIDEFKRDVTSGGDNPTSMPDGIS
jgi:hypothetical protein